MHENGGMGENFGNIIVYIMATFSFSTPIESLNNTALISHHGTCACILQIRHLQFHRAPNSWNVGLIYGLTLS
jgi:hypothetical protein